MSGIENVLLNGSIAEISTLYRSRRLSVAEAVSWYIARVERFRHLNAVREISGHALHEAKLADVALAKGADLGPLHGIPVLLKDNIFVSGMKASAGARALAQFEPSRDAGLVSRLRVAGCIVLGKTNMTEFADYVSDVMPSEFSGAGGVVKNPHGIRYDRGAQVSGRRHPWQHRSHRSRSAAKHRTLFTRPHATPRSSAISRVRAA